ncbi:MAG: PilN domain-containing protein [Deltaproteobacteria bacterium]|nr:PilN domain-containing protein [Deltaproteobacteria bacterium]
MIERINLIPDEVRNKKKAAQKRPLVIGLLVFYILGLGAFYFYQKAKIKERLHKIELMGKERDTLITQNARYKEIIERINLTQKRGNEIKKRLDIINVLLEGRVYWSEILRSITHIVPDGVWLMSLSTYDISKGPGKGVKCSGTAISNSGIAEFVFALENSQFFRNILLNYSQKRELQGRDIYDFEITADLREARK